MAIIGIGLGTLGAILEPTIQGYLSGRTRHGSEGIASPLELGTSATTSGVLSGVAWLMILGTIIASVVLLIVRLRRASDRERSQLRLFISAALVGMAVVLPAFALPENVAGDKTVLLYVAGGSGLLLIPVSVGVAIVRHQLLDIDLVIRRTVVIAILGAFITALYVAIVVGVGAVVGNSGNVVLSPAAAAMVALAFQPMRRWAQRVSNRFVYGDRATPYEVLHEFSERVAGSYGTEDVLPRMATILGEGTGADRAQVWLKVGSELRPTAAWPEGAERSRPVHVPSPEHLPEMDGVSAAVPVQDKGELLGALTVTKAPADPVTPTEERLVGDLALQASLVLRNVRLVEDLRASRGRLVAAQDEERRKIERNIHDGAQQQLVALAVKAKLAEALLDTDPSKARGVLSGFQAEALEALEALRDLARGIYPPLLADKGLVAAIEAQARKAPMPVTVSAEGVGRYPREIEATVYFCCLEAIQNASKYSGASGVEIALHHTEDALAFEVADDGRGFDVGSTPRGAGLQNMTDRREAVGGELVVTSSPGRGTKLAARTPRSTR